MIIGEPIKTEGLDKASIRELDTKVRDIIVKNMKESLEERKKSKV